MGSSRRISIKKNMIIFGIGIFFTKILNLVFAPIFSHYMSTNEFGIVDILTTTGFLLIPICTLAITEAVIKYGISDDSDNKKVITNGIIVTAVGIVVLITITLFLGQFIYKDYVFFAILYYCFECLFLFLQSVSKSMQKTTDYVISSILYSIVSIFLIFVLLISTNLGVSGYLIGLSVGGFVGSFYLIIRLRIWKKFSIKCIERKTIVLMLRYAAPLSFSGIAYWLISASDKYITRILMGESSTGLLAVVHKLPAVCTFLYSIFNFAFILSALKDHKLKPETYDEDCKFYSTTLRYVAILLILGSILIILMSLPMTLLYSSDFHSCWIFIPLYSFGVILGAFRNFYSSIFMTVGKTFKIMIVVIIGALINVLSCYFLMKYTSLGLWATAISTVLANAFIFIAFIFLSKGIVDLHFSVLLVFLLIGCFAVSIFPLFSNNIIVFYSSAAALMLFTIFICHKDIAAIFKLIFRKKDSKT